VVPYNRQTVIVVKFVYSYSFELFIMMYIRFSGMFTTTIHINERIIEL